MYGALSRACGSISFSPQLPALIDGSFPRVREYFLLLMMILASALLFPARAGVFPGPENNRPRRRALSRACGSISRPELLLMCTPNSFPRVREYFLMNHSFPFNHRLFPARAGVFPQTPFTGDG